MGRHRPDGRARHEHGHGHFRPCGSAQLRPGDRQRRAKPGAAGPGRDPGLSRRRRCRDAAPAAEPENRGGLMDWLFFGEVSVAGLATGGLYALIALGFVIIYKATRVINFAIGEIMMFAAYLFLSFAGGMQLPPLIALPLAVLGGTILGGVVEKVMIRPM